MPSERHPQVYSLITVLFFAGAAGFVFFALELLLQAIYGHGGGAGNILRLGLAVGSLFLGFFLLAVGTLYRKSLEEDRAGQAR